MVAPSCLSDGYSQACGVPDRIRGISLLADPSHIVPIPVVDDALARQAIKMLWKVGRSTSR